MGVLNCCGAFRSGGRFLFCQMDKVMDKQNMEAFLRQMLIVSVSPIAFLLLIFMALLKLLQFLSKALFLFIIVAITTPFAVIYNVSLLMIEYKLLPFLKPDAPHQDWFDPRTSVGIEVQLIVSDFCKVVAGELLLVISTGIITFYTASRPAFYISMSVGVTAILFKWLNTNSLSKTAFSCLCDGYGLNPIMFLFSFLGLFDIGCHPVAKCSFTARRAFLFATDIEAFSHLTDSEDEGNEHLGWFSFNQEMTTSEIESIEFKWCAFQDRGLFQLNPRIDFIHRKNEKNGKNGKYILKSFMDLKLLGKKLFEYPVERQELPEDYSKAKELYNFLDTLSIKDGFVTNKMSGRYEHSLTLSQIIDGVQQNAGYRVVKPIDERFVVASFTNSKH